jgi:uncharacterized membrane protein YoaT (DUF817 family)
MQIYPLLAIILLGAIVLTSLQFFGHYLYDVRLESSAVVIMVFGKFHIFHIPYHEIANIRRASLMRAMLLPLSTL